MRRPRFTVRRLMIIVAVVAILLMAVRSRMMPPPQALAGFGSMIEVQWSDGTHTLVSGKTPYPERQWDYPLVTIVKWSDGSFSVYFPPAKSREPR